jgi:cephalosporin-C deacetylase
MTDNNLSNTQQCEYGFDPGYGYSLEQLQAVKVPKKTKHFDAFWQKRYQTALTQQPNPSIQRVKADDADWQIFTISYTSTENFPIHGWLLIPDHGKIKRGFIIGHGYGGREVPDFNLPFKDAVLFFPCFRGLGLSVSNTIPSDPFWHIRHGIENPDRYILGDCVDDLWLATTALLTLYPQLTGHLGFLGLSFSGGIGALALQCETRIARAHLNVPTFGDHLLRLRLPSQGSALSLQQYYQTHKKQTLQTLRYFDAANAATEIKIPVHCALAKFDPVVAPPGQFAIYNAISGEKHLYILEAGHYSYANEAKEQLELLDELDNFFAGLGDEEI